MIRKKKWLPDEEKILARLASVGATSDQIARRLRRPDAAVRTRAISLGLTLKTKQQRAAELRKSPLNPMASAKDTPMGTQQQIGQDNRPAGHWEAFCRAIARRAGVIADPPR